MNYRNRHVEAKISRYRELFPAILVVGARQVGKSTLLQHLFGDSMPQVVFDPVTDIGAARSDPDFFLDQHPAPIILDEIQYSPELLPAIKRHIDENHRPGQYFLTGSQNLSLMRTISESLAGRVVVIELETMSLQERLGQAESSPKTWVDQILDAGAEAPDFSECARLDTGTTLFEILWRGGYPGVLDFDNSVLPDYFGSYRQTYVERDIRTIAEVSDQQTFSRFFGICAALTAQEVNYSQLGRDIGVTPQTAQRWLSILRATYQWLELQPYHGNTIKRISGKPKGFLSDTGLACYLQRISSPEALSAHPMLGALFETHVALDVRHLFARRNTPPQVYHWRSHGGAEVDLLLERDGIFWPIEVKCKSRVTKADARGIHAFRETYPSLAHGVGVIVAAVREVSWLESDIVVIPYDLA